MSNFKKKPDNSKNDKVRKDWESLKYSGGLSTREKLEKLVNRNIGKSKSKKPDRRDTEITERFESEKTTEDVTIRDYVYSLDEMFGGVRLGEWKNIDNRLISVMFNDTSISEIDPVKFLYFDTETTGLSGGTGTIPFMLGFGFFDEEVFRVRIFILNDLSAESGFLEEIDDFLNEHDFSATVTYNGRTFDFPLMETRYILNRKRFPLLKLPHLDFLPPARIIWKNTYESRRLGFLGDILLDISRDDDVPGSLIPSLYFNYLRTGNFDMIENVIDHNALDIVGLSALLLLGMRYLSDFSNAIDEGEILGVGRLYERSGDLKKAEELYGYLGEKGSKDQVVVKAVKRLAMIKKKKQLLKEAADLWETISGTSDHKVIRELSIHYEHREKNFHHALELVEKGLGVPALTERQKKDLEKRVLRLKKKIEKLEMENSASSGVDKA